jgi:hypothetical protein
VHPIAIIILHVHAVQGMNDPNRRMLSCQPAWCNSMPVGIRAACQQTLVYNSPAAIYGCIDKYRLDSLNACWHAFFTFWKNARRVTYVWIPWGNVALFAHIVMGACGFGMMFPSRDLQQDLEKARVQRRRQRLQFLFGLSSSSSSSSSSHDEEPQEDAWAAFRRRRLQRQQQKAEPLKIGTCM